MFWLIFLKKMLVLEYLFDLWWTVFAVGPGPAAVCSEDTAVPAPACTLSLQHTQFTRDRGEYWRGNENQCQLGLRAAQSPFEVKINFSFTNSCTIHPWCKPQFSSLLSLLLSMNDCEPGSLLAFLKFASNQLRNDDRVTRSLNPDIFPYFILPLLHFLHWCIFHYLS